MHRYLVPPVRQCKESARNIYASNTGTMDFAADIVKEIAHHYGGVTASTEVIAVKRHTGVHASVTVCKNTIANQNLAYAA